jgi:hypothetical protein
MITALLMVAIIVAIAIIGILLILADPIFNSQAARRPNILLSGYSETGSRWFDPGTILSSLDRGSRDVFKTSPTTNEILPSVVLSWKQSDYTRIAGALQQYVWGEPIDDWKMESAFFYGDCQYEPLGFDVINIIYFKANSLRSYSAHKIDIYPFVGKVDWGEETNYPRSLFVEWRSIDPEELKVTVEDALQLAEKNGGRAARSMVKNDCRIHASLTTGKGVAWSIFYDSTYNSNYPNMIFSITVDPYTGDYKILTVAQ